ncbi:hypothetical protein VNO77_17478 [Canavalia gladiata]|uniref:ABC transporter domain-containing protein n=1 Tax=Canavalia gladiata TaxID=3824 RepID=A0AAN9LIY9_CANGL
MEGGGSFRIGSSSIWRDSDAKVFSNSFHQEDDEEALKWASIQKLPTVARLRKGLFTTPEGEANEIDILKLGMQERRALLQRLLRTAEEDNEGFLLKLKDRIDRVGIDLPTIEVRFEHLNIEAEAHVGTRALPTFTNFMVNIVEGLLNSLHIIPSRRQHINILRDVSGIIKPGRMTLLLGPPSSGKTTLLLALAAKLNPNLKFSGKVTYNGHGMDEFVPQRTAAYVNQNDLHVGELTVRETLAFSARVQGVGTRYDLLAELSRREKEANIKPDPDIDVYMKAVATEGQKANLITDYVLRILGLEVCADTIVGNAMLRGISGGQRKRVTTGEMLVGPARALFMDEISTGLDSSTTFQIVNSLKQCVHIFKGTTVISLLQPAPETYNLFDDIILLSDSHIVYQGPREHVLEFFESMGFQCPERKGVADFLQEVTSRKDQEQYWAHKDRPYRFITAKEFFESHRLFHVGRSLGEELATEFDKSKSHPAALTTKNYGVGKWELLKACLSREYLLMKRNSFVYTFKLCQLAVMAIVAMTIFLRTEMRRDSVIDGGIYVGALFYAVVVIMFNGLAELSMVVTRLPVFYKQRNNMFYPSWAFALPAWILKIPMTFVEVGVWVCLTYYVIGFDPHIGRFFRQYLLLVLVNQMASALFRLIAAVGRDLTVAVTFGSFSLAILFSMSGFLLSKDNLKKWWLWGFWISPMMYGQNAMVNNEFFGKRWRHVLPNSTEPLGVEVLKSRGFFTQSYWYWIGVGALIGYTLLFNLGYILALTYLNPPEKHQSVISEKPESNEQDGASQNRTSMLRHIKYSLSQHSRKVKNGESMSGSTETISGRQRGMVLPFEPHSIAFDEVTYAVDMPQLLLMKQGGQEIYVGPLGHHSSNLITYFEGIQGVSKIKDGHNPATWMLEITTSAKEMDLGIDFAEVYKNSELYSEKQQDLFNAMGSMYAAVLLIGIKNATSVQPVVAVERTVFYRERAAGMYSALPYAFAQATVVYSIIIYAMIGFEWTVVKFFWCLFFMYFTFLYFTYYGMMSVAVTPNLHISSIVSSAFYSVWNIFSGFIIPRPRIPVWWRWYSWANPIAWSLYGLVASQYGDIKQSLESTDGSTTVEGFVRSYFGFKHDFLGVVAVVIIAFPVGFALVFAMSVKMFNFQRR